MTDGLRSSPLKTLIEGGSVGGGSSDMEETIYLDRLHETVRTFAEIMPYDDEEFNQAAIDFDDDTLDLSMLENFREENIESIMDEEDSEDNYTLDTDKYNYNDDNVDLEFEDLIGLDDIKKLLVNKIVKPHKWPEHYAGITEAKKVCCVYGQDGGGKRTVIKAFCKMLGMRLLIINGKIVIEGMMENLLEYASHNQPCLIFFDCCDHFFRNGVNDNIGKGFVYAYTTNKMEKEDVWTVIGTRSLYTSEFFHNMKEFIGTANSARVTDYTKHQRKMFFRRFLGSQYKISGHRNFNDEEFEELLEELANYSRKHTPKHIKEYVAKVFSAKLDDMKVTDMMKCNLSSHDKLPNKSDFINIMYRPPMGPPRLCKEDVARQSEVYRMYAQNELGAKTPQSQNNQKPRRSNGRLRVSSNLKRSSSAANLPVNGKYAPPSKKLKSNSFNNNNNEKRKQYFKDNREAIDGPPQLI